MDGHKGRAPGWHSDTCIIIEYCCYIGNTNILLKSWVYMDLLKTFDRTFVPNTRFCLWNISSVCLGGVTVASVGLWLISNDGKNCDDHSDTSVAMDDTATDEEDEDETTERWCSNIKIVFIQIIKSLEVNWCYFFLIQETYCSFLAFS